MQLVEAWRDDVEQLGGKHIVFHECELPQDLNFPQNFSRGVLVVESIANLFNGHDFFGNSVAGSDDPTEAALATNINELEVLLDEGPFVGQLDHLAPIISEEA